MMALCSWKIHLHVATTAWRSAISITTLRDWQLLDYMVSVTSEFHGDWNTPLLFL